ncbi:MAG: isoprenyl transferase [Bacteroidetes bacterium]|nr:MAG: isoprenyl transferase [Bacteroidota bacterium]
MDFKQNINKNKLPKHIAIIMDGNGRWAKQRGKERIFGHENGVQAVRETVEAAGEIGVKHLTFYAFSTENWCRPKSEVNTLMELLVNAIKNETPELLEKGVKLNAIGDIDSLPEACIKELKEAIEITKNNTRLTVTVALSYSSQWEIVNAVKQIARKVKENKIDPENIDKNLFKQFLQTHGIPDPDLLIRTSGELRISNFMLWQIAYSELYFTPVMWPDFRKKHLYQAILDYQRRERRFGKT